MISISMWPLWVFNAMMVCTMYVCVYVCVRVYMWVCVRVWVCVHVWVCGCGWVRLNVYQQSWPCALFERSHTWQSRRVPFCLCCRHLQACLRRDASPYTSHMAQSCDPSSRKHTHTHTHQIYHVAQPPTSHKTTKLSVKTSPRVSPNCRAVLKAMKHEIWLLYDPPLSLYVVRETERQRGERVSERDV